MSVTLKTLVSLPRDSPPLPALEREREEKGERYRYKCHQPHAKQGKGENPGQSPIEMMGPHRQGIHHCILQLGIPILNRLVKLHMNLYGQDKRDLETNAGERERAQSRP